MSILNQILYLTDKSGVSSGYQPLFNKLVMGRGILPNQVLVASIYGLVDGSPLKKKAANQKAWILNPEKLEEVRKAVDNRIALAKPKMIVTCCPAVLGLIHECDPSLTSIEKTRGSVYEYKGIPVVITYPISAINRRTDDKTSAEFDVEGVTPYKVKAGKRILVWDWEKIARIFKGEIREMPAFDYSVCRTLTDCRVALEFLSRCEMLGTDIETKGGFRPDLGKTEYFQSCIGFSGVLKDGRMKTFVFPIYDKFKESGAYWDKRDISTVWKLIKEILELPNIKTMQNGAYDCSYFIRDRIPPVNYIADTMHMWHSVFPELKKGLDFLVSILCDNYSYWKEDIKGLDEEDASKRDTNMEGYWRYNALDCYYTLCATLILWQMLQGNPKLVYNYKHEMMQMAAGLKMSMRGIRADKKRLAVHREELTCKAIDAENRLRFITADPDFNANSPAQKAHLFYNILGATPRAAGGKLLGKTSRKSPSADEKCMKLLQHEHPLLKVFVDAILATTKPKKQISNICNMTLDSERFRYHLGAAATETRRYNGKKSNFWDGTNPQNITKKMRDWLVADPDQILIDIDYSQSDAVFVAYESNDPKYIETVTCGKDSHAIHAEDFFKVPYDAIIAGKKAGDDFIMHPQTGIRPLTKRVVHGANFQMMAYTLFTTMGRDAVIAAAKALGHENADSMNEKELIAVCSSLLHVFRSRYKRLNPGEWYGEIATQLKNFGYIDNAYGFRRNFMGAWDDLATQREGTAFYGQSDTASNMNRTLNEIIFGYIPKEFRDGPNPHANEKPLILDHVGSPLKVLLQVHDSFICSLNMKQPEWKTYLNNLLTVMERPCIINGHEMHVPVECELMTAWGVNTVELNRQEPNWLDNFDISTLTK